MVKVFFSREKIQIISAESFPPALFRMCSMHGFSGCDPVRPRAHPSRVTERRKLARDHPQCFLQDVLRSIGIPHNCIDVVIQLSLNRAQQTIERFSIAGLCPRDEEQIVSAICQWALIDSRAISTRPTEREM